jgi:hypothetical protein
MTTLPRSRRWLSDMHGIRHETIRSEKAQADRRWFVPRVETLEDRLAPATIVVNSTADDGSMGNLFRNAIMSINAGGDRNGATHTGTYGNNDTIDFSNTLSGSIGLNSALQPLNKSVLIDGSTSAPAGIIIDGGSNFQIFNINAGKTVTINKLVLQHGSVTDASGGAILNAGNLTLTNVVLTNNTVNDTSNNDTNLGGGAVSNSGTLNVTNSTFASNMLMDPANGGNNNNAGAAIFNSGTATITGSTFSGNQQMGANTGDNGGAIDNTGTMSVTNSTFNGNTSTNSGGAIDNTSGMLTVKSSTIAGNMATANGGGIRVQAGTVILKNTVVSANTAGMGPDLNGTFSNTSTFDFVGDTTNLTGFTPVATGNAMLNGLASNGGPTQTLSTQASSPLIEAGDPADSNGVITDQRGVVRGPSGKTTIGAYQPAAPTLGTISPSAWTVNQLNFMGMIPITGGTSPYTLVTDMNEPTGLSAAVVGSNIVVSGTPTGSTSSTVNISIKDAAGVTVSTGNFTITINPVLNFSPATLPLADVGHSYNQTLTVTGGTKTGAPLSYTSLTVTGFNAGGTGLTLPTTDATAGTVTISGTPTAAGTVMFTVNVTDATGATLPVPYSITVKPALSISPSSPLPGDDVGVAYATQTLTVSGGTGSYTTFSVTGFSDGGTGFAAPTPNMGAGTFTLNGITPTAAGTVSFTVNVTDSAGGMLTMPYTLTVSPPVSLPATLPGSDVNVPYNQIIMVQGTGPYTIMVTGFSAGTTGLPPGFVTFDSMAGTVTVNGTPTSVGAVTFTVNVKDAVGAMASQTYTIPVSPALTISPTLLPADDVSVPYNQTITVSGGTTPYTTFSLNGSYNDGGTGLPAPTLDPVGGTIKFNSIVAPIAAGTVTFTVTVTDSAGPPATLSTMYTITVNPKLAISPGSLPVDDVNHFYNQTITVSGGSQSGGPPASYPTLSVTGFMAGGTGLTAPTVDPVNGRVVVSGTPSASGTVTFTVTVIDAAGDGISQPYSITVNPPLNISPTSLPVVDASVPYNQTITVSGGGSPASYTTFSVTGFNAGGTGLSAPTVNAAAGTVTISGTPTGQGTVMFTVNVTDAAGSTINQPYSITVNPKLSSSPLTGGDVGQLYNQTITVSGGTQSGGPPASYPTFSVSGFSAGGTGLAAPTLDPVGGTIKFNSTPSGMGNVTFTVNVSDTAGGTLMTPYTIPISPTLSISPASLPGGEVTAPYNQTITVSQGTQPYTTLSVTGFSAGGTGLSAPTTNAATGMVTISGTPTGIGTVSFMVNVTDTAGAMISQPYSITVISGLSISPTGPALPPADVGTIYNQGLMVIGGTMPYTTLTLVNPVTSMSTYNPGGTGLAAPVVNAGAGTVTFNSAPTAAGTVTFTVYVVDSKGGNSSQSYTIAVGNALSFSSTLTGADTGVPYNQHVTIGGGSTPYTTTVTGFSAGGTGLAYSINGAMNQVTISGTPMATGTVSFTVNVTDHAGVMLSQMYSINVTSTPVISPLSLPVLDVNQLYNQTITVTGGAQPYTTFSVNPFSPGTTGLMEGSFVSTNASTGKIVLNGTPMLSGTVTFTVNVTDSAGFMLPAQNYTITVNPDPTISPLTLPVVDVGEAYNQTIMVSGGTTPYNTFSVSGFNAGGTGLAAPTTNPAAGTVNISGTPTGHGTVTFTVNVTDNVGSTITQPYSITVNPALSISPAALTTPIDANKAYNQTITVSGGTTPYTTFTLNGSYSDGGTGLAAPTLDPVGGTITFNSTPTKAGIVMFTVNVTDAAGGTLTTNYSITVNPAITFGTLSSTTFQIGVPYSGTISVTGGTPGAAPSNYTNLTSSYPNPSPPPPTLSGLPHGLTAALDTTNGNTINITGIPTEAGTYNVTFTVQDSINDSFSQTYPITITSPNLSLTPVTLPTAVAGQAYNQVITAIGEKSPPATFTYSIKSTGMTPSIATIGLSFDPSTGTLSGTPRLASITNASQYGPFAPSFAGPFKVTPYTFDITATDNSTGTGAPFSVTGHYTLTVNPASASKFVVKLGTLSPVAGTQFDVTLTALDAFNNPDVFYKGTVAFTSSDPLAENFNQDSAQLLPSLPLTSLPPNYTFTTGGAGNDNAQHIFLASAGKGASFRTATGSIKRPLGYTGNPNNNSISPLNPALTAGQQTITVTDVANSSISGTSSPATVSPAATASYFFDTFAQSSNGSSAAPINNKIPVLFAGPKYAFTLTAVDQFDNVTPSYNGSVSFSSTDSSAGAVTTPMGFASQGGGVYVYNPFLVLEDPNGEITFTATDTVSGIQASQLLRVNNGSGFNVVLLADTNGTISANPLTTDVAGNNLALQVSVLEPDGFTTNTGYTGTVQIYLVGYADSQATITNPNTGITVVATPFGSANPPAQSVFGFTYTYTAADMGTHTFLNLTLRASGNINSNSITPQDIQVVGTHDQFIALKTLVGDDTPKVSPSAFDHVTVQVNNTGATADNPTIAGNPQSVTVLLQDQFGNQVFNSDNTDTLHFVSTDPKVMPGNVSLLLTDNGKKTLSLTFFTASITPTATGSQTLTVNVSGEPGGNKSGSAPVFIHNAAVSKFVIDGAQFGTSFPSPAVAGTSISFLLVAEDAYSNVAIDYTGTASFTSTDAAARQQFPLPAPYPFNPGDKGEHGFQVTFVKANDGAVPQSNNNFQTITATGTIPGSNATITGSASTQVNPAAPDMLQLSALQQSAFAGLDQKLVATLYDNYKNVVNTYQGNVVFSTNDGLAKVILDKATNQLANLNGYNSPVTNGQVVLGDVELRTAATGLTEATSTVVKAQTGSLPAEQDGIQTKPAAPASVVFSGLPGALFPNQTVPFTITVVDQFGNPAVGLGYNGTVSLSASDPSAPPLPSHLFSGGIFPDNYPNAAIFVVSPGVTFKNSGNFVITATGTFASGPLTPSASAQVFVSGVLPFTQDTTTATSSTSETAITSLASNTAVTPILVSVTTTTTTRADSGSSGTTTVVAGNAATGAGAGTGASSVNTDQPNLTLIVEQGPIGGGPKFIDPESSGSSGKQELVVTVDAETGTITSRYQPVADSGASNSVNDHGNGSGVVLVEENIDGSRFTFYASLEYGTNETRSSSDAKEDSQQRNNHVNDLLLNPNGQPVSSSTAPSQDGTSSDRRTWHPAAGVLTPDVVSDAELEALFLGTKVNDAADTDAAEPIFGSALLALLAASANDAPRGITERRQKSSRKRSRRPDVCWSN